VDEEEDEVDEEEVNSWVNYSENKFKGTVSPFFYHEFFVRHPSPDPDNYISFVSIFRKFAKMQR